MEQTLTGIGLYTLSEAAHILQLKTSQLRRWVEGYSIYSTDRRRIPPVIWHGVLRLNGEIILTFHDLLELNVIRLFRQAGVSLQTIRLAIKRASELFETERPFILPRLATDGKRIFVELSQKLLEEREEPSRSRIMMDINKGQLVLESIAREFFVKLDYGGLEPLRYWPKGRDNHIVIDPHRAFGKPIEDKSGVPTAILYQMFQNGTPPTDIARWYNMDEAAVNAAISYEQERRQAA